LLPTELSLYAGEDENIASSSKHNS
jgi:hypothetical protein